MEDVAMPFEQPDPITINYTDPSTGDSFVLVSKPTDGLEAGTVPRDSVKLAVLGWNWLILSWDHLTKSQPVLKSHAKEAIPIIDNLIERIDVQTLEPNDGQGVSFQYFVTMKSQFSHLVGDTFERKEMTPFTVSLVEKAIDLLSVKVAIATMFEVQGGERVDTIAGIDTRPENERLPIGIINGPAPPAGDNPTLKTKRLFSNSRDLKASEWGMPKFIADGWGRALRSVNQSAGIEQYNQSAQHSRGRKAAFSIRGKETETEFVFDKTKLAITTAEQFVQTLMKLKDAKVLQTFFALMKWANTKDSAVFRDVPISEIMSLILKSGDSNKFNTPQRRDFSQVLSLLASMTINVDVIGERINKKTGKGRPVLRVERDVKLFDLVAEYSVRKEFQSMPKEALIADIHFDKSVINRFSGELLPGKGHLFQERASVYFDSLLHLDANKDSKAIVLGFQIQTRFNQLQDKEQCIEYDRGFVIDLCDYAQADSTKPSRATSNIANNLEKLKKAGIISGYSGLTNTNSDRIKIYPPIAKPIKAK